MTTKQAAEILGVSTQQIQNYCRNLGFKKIGRDWLLTDEQVELIRPRIGNLGRPKEQDNEKD